MMRHGQFPGLGPAAGHRSLEPLPLPELLEKKIAFQTAEIERLAGDNRRFAATHVVLRQDLVAAQQGAEKIKAHIRSIQTESDIQIRVLLDKIAKMEADIRVGESVKKNLQQAHLEAQGLVKARQDLATQIEQATQELQKVHADVKKLPEMHGELESLRQEHQRLRATFEYEKGINIEQVERLQVMEKKLIGMARDMENLRAEVLNAERRAYAPNPYEGVYVNPEPSYPHPMQGSVPCVDGYGRPLVQIGIVAAGEEMFPYSSSNDAVASGGFGSAAYPNESGGAVWGGAYDPALVGR